VSPSHGSRLEDVSNLGVDGLVVTSPVEVGTVSRCCLVRRELLILKLGGEEQRKPLVIDNVLVSGNGELTSTVEQPLVFFFSVREVGKQLLGPELVDTEPQDSHGEEERVFITTRVADG